VVDDGASFTTSIQVYRDCVTRLASLFVIIALAVLGLLVAPATGVSSGPSIRITLPKLVRSGTVITVSGRMRNAPAEAVLALQQLVPATGNPPLAWEDIVQWRARGAVFALRWRPATTGILTVRVAVRTAGIVRAVSGGQALRVGLPPAYCNAPAPSLTQVPAGDGVLMGTLDVLTGAPARYACMVGAYTITVADPTGSIVASVPVPAGQSYAIALPAGSYRLKSGSCEGTATIVAGMQVRADTVCFVHGPPVVP
jgi:hypothetical protein